MKCPESIEELQEIERLIPLCKTTLYDQAKARIETGEAKSVSEASRQLGEETGKSHHSISTAIYREQENRTDSLSELSGTDKHRPVNEQFRTSYTGDNEWYTPVEYIEAAREVMGEIDIDPATSDFGQSRIKASTHYTVKENGLKAPWIGRVWLNPPYSQPDIGYFVDRLVYQLIEVKCVKEAIVLTHNYTDTKWFHSLAEIATCICFTKGRIKYEKTDGTIAAPTQGAAFFYLGNNLDRFKEVFNKFGFIYGSIT